MKKEYRPQNLSTRRDFLLGTVQWTKDRKVGSSRQLAKTAGLLKVIEDSDAEPCFFEESGWDAYRPANPDGKHHWKIPIMVPAKLDDVDHIIYLPRVSSHISVIDYLKRQLKT